ncbi:MAG: membrane integrity-associated transporter subunit PqiC [Bdellovibrionales bacterium]|nr:membrane integrity-associated transporter subunit PqiC [Bdellovibrionales bacterium]
MNCIAKASILALLVILSVGCSSSRPTSYYVLNGREVVSQELTSSGSLLELGPITLPGYLDRRGIVVRTDEHALSVSDLHQWAEELDENIARVLQRELEACGKYDQVVLYPAPRGLSSGKRIQIVLDQFERLESGDVKIAAWIDSSSSDGTQTHSLFALQNSCPDASSYSATVSCLDALVVALAEELC